MPTNRSGLQQVALFGDCPFILGVAQGCIPAFLCPIMLLKPDVLTFHVIHVSAAICKTTKCPCLSFPLGRNGVHVRARISGLNGLAPSRLEDR